MAREPLVLILRSADGCLYDQIPLTVPGEEVPDLLERLRGWAAERQAAYDRPVPAPAPPRERVHLAAMAERSRSARAGRKAAGRPASREELEAAWARARRIEEARRAANAERAAALQWERERRGPAPPAR